MSKAAEETLCGMVLLDPTLRLRAQVDYSQFENPECQAIWKAMGTLAESDVEIDIISLAAELGSKLKGVGGLPTLTRMAGAVGTASNAEYYADLIREDYLRRQVKAKCVDILSQSDDTSGEDLLAMLNTSSDALTASLSAPTHTLAGVVADQINIALRASCEAQGLPTGLGVDRWFPGGFPRGKIVMLQADTATFKTTAVNQMIFNMAAQGYPGLLVPLEDSDELTAHRWMSRTTGINYGRIAGGICNDAERQIIAKLSPGQWKHLELIRSCDGIDPKIDNIIREVASAKAQNPDLAWVAVDYMQLIEGKGNPQDVITHAMKRSANAAKRYNICWIWLTQVNDGAKDRKDPRPALNDAFGSKSMKQMAKTVLALFKPSEEWPNPTGNNPMWGMYSRLREVWGEARFQENYPNIVELWCLKNVLGKKKSMQVLIAKPEVGILDPLPMKEMIR